MKKLLFAVVFLCFISTVFWYLTLPYLPPIPIYLPKNSIETSTNHQEAIKCIQNINNRSNQIKSLYFSNISINCQQKNTINVTGEMAMKREKYFRLIISHRLTGKEMDIGSNNDIFWFWSKRMNPPYLHYAKLEDINSTMLRPALDPNWIMESILGEIKLKDAQIVNFKNFFAVLQERIGTQGKITVMTLIDPKKQIIIGKYLYNSQNKLIVSIEMQEFNSNLIPKKLLIIWHEENIVMEWKLSNPQINMDISPKYWQMPIIRNKVNLSEN